MLINEENYLEQLVKRNEDALYYVIDTYGGLIKSIVAKHLSKLQTLQEECVDDVLLAIWENIASFSPEKNTFKNWVGAVAKYKSIDYKRKYLKLLNQENIEEFNLQSNSNTEEKILEQELGYEIESLLAQLKEEDRKIFIQYYVESQDVESIAREMRIKKADIYNRLSRGRAKLRKMYGTR